MNFKSTRSVQKNKPVTPGKTKDTVKTTEKVSGTPARRAAVSASSHKKFINVYLSLGSNLNDRLDNLKSALSLIHQNIGKIARASSVYETQPWGKTHQNTFLNMVVMINTTKQPREILDEIAKIDQTLGRQRTEKWGPRIIDIDILFYGKRIIRDKGLEIPHPHLHQRAFVLVPLLEIAPDFEHPQLRKPIDQLYMECEDHSEVVHLPDIPLNI